VRALVAGLTQLWELAGMINTEIANASTAAGTLRTGLTGIGTDAATAATGAATLLAQLCGPMPSLPVAACTTLGGVAAAAGRAAQGTSAMVDPLTALLTSLGKLNAYGTVLAQALESSVTAGKSLLIGMDAIAAALGAGTPGQPGLAAGLAGLTDGLVKFADALASSSAQLAKALGQVATGTDKLADGVSMAADGAAKLAEGSSAVAAGATRAADGAELLAAGISGLATGADQAAAGGARLAKGAAQFQAKGTAAVADSVLTASTQPAMAQAWLAAAGARAADALPYGPPEGATGHVAYLMTIPATDAPPANLWDRIMGWFSG
jgi:putative membrane protein